LEISLFKVIHRIGPVAGLVVLAALISSSCEGFKEDPAQVMLFIDADPEVRAAVHRVRLTIFGDFRDFPTDVVHTEEYEVSGDDASWQRTVALAPRDQNMERKFRYEIVGFGETPQGEDVVLRRIGYGRYEWRIKGMVKVMLTGDCLSVLCPNAQWSCEQGRCVDSFIEIHGRHRECTEDSQCDDRNDCTHDSCDEEGLCARTFDDSLCRDDEACVSHGCEQGRYGLHCGGGEFVEPYRICDGVPDCSSGADEAQCQRGWPCFDGRVIAFEQLCDGNVDCDGEEDEEEGRCPEGPVGRTRCPYDYEIVPETIDTAQLCDGMVDCEDGSDEDEWLCRYVFVCDGGGTVLEYPSSYVCDGRIDCADGSDEMGCMTVHGWWW
jgi:hypothetical protein